MPWHVVDDHEECNGEEGTYGVVKDADGSLVACHMSREAAQRQIDALYANEGGKMLNKTRSAEFKSLVGEGKPEGTFSAVVAVYGNVDKVGDRILDNAFDQTLENWKKSGDPIPIVLAHEWKDPFAHIGFAMPDKVKSVPGVGLVVEEGHLDIHDNPTAAQVYKLMGRRSLKEFSFGYTVPDGGQKKASDGALDLSNLNLIEFGPCLKGVNDSTQLLAVKSTMTGDEPSLEDRVTKMEESLALLVKAVNVEADSEEKAWNGSQSNYTDEQYAAACILDRGADFSEGAKTRYSLPIAVPGKSFSDPDPEGVRAAASRIGTVGDATGEQVKTAYKRLLGAYTKLDIEPPASVVDGAKEDLDIDVKDEPVSLERQMATTVMDSSLALAEGDLESKGIGGSRLDVADEWDRKLKEIEMGLN